MPMNPRLLRPTANAETPEADPPVQLKAENSAVLVTEGGEQLSTE